MAKIPLSNGGVAWRYSGESRESVDRWRESLKAAGEPTDSLLDPLTEPELEAIYAMLNSKYGVNLVAAEDHGDLKFAIERVAGERSARSATERASRQIKDFERLISAIETISEFAAKPTTGLVDIRDRLTQGLLDDAFAEVSPLEKIRSVG